MKLVPALPSAIILLSLLSACQDAEEYQYATYEEYPVYKGKDLGVTYSSEAAVFKLWSPAVQSVRLHIYENGTGGEPLNTYELTRGEKGVWEVSVPGDQNGKYYTFQVRDNGKWLSEVPDPYAKAAGVNGKRGMIIDLDETDPEGWEGDERPLLNNFSDIILYELHVRDLSMHDNSGIEHQGKFLGLTETGTTGPQGQLTGLDHIKELGITHVHLLPSFDFMSIDESNLEENNFNWGYDPQNYNIPEGSYSTDPADGRVRIKEFKQMVKTLHDNGLRVIMDVVYNHTGATEESNFNQLVPGYYYRHNEDGSFSDASACGNETASEREMVRRFIMESVTYWATEYHIDGFRFDLMGIHDMETMNMVRSVLHRVDPTIFIYGEGWTAGDSPLPEEKRALKKHTKKMQQIAAFSDDIRDGIKGSVFEHEDPGFASGKPGMAESIKFGIVASTEHPQIDYQKVNYSNEPWAGQPFQTITYFSCHDNHTLWDKLAISRPDATEEERIRMHKLAAAIVLTSQGVSFLHAGSEMLRTKQGEENSYKSPDAINKIDWSRKVTYQPVYDYFRGLVQMRKNHSAFRIPSTKMIQSHLSFLDSPDDLLVAYQLKGNANGDPWRNIVVIFNGNREYKRMEIPKGEWTIVVDDEKVDEKGLGTIDTEEVTVPPSSAMVLVSE